MTPKMKTFGSLGVTLLPLCLLVILIAVGRENDLWIVLFLATILSRGVIGLGWLLHMLRNKEVEQAHKILWAVVLFLEAWAMVCVGSLGVAELVYWYRHVYRSYEIDRMHHAMRGEEL